MTRFTEWCTITDVPHPGHKLCLLTADEAKRTHAISVVSASVPDNYTSPARLAGLLARLGRKAVADHVLAKLPTLLAIKSGDLGEIFCTAYVHESTAFKLGIRRLRWKDHRNMAMRGDDVLAFHIPAAGRVRVLKAEVKSRAKMQTSVIEEARSALDDYKELPSPHAIGFVADRLGETGDKALQDAIDEVQLKRGLKKSQVTHMLFAFSGNDATKMLQTNLSGYAGSVSQHYVGLRISGHKQFVNDVFAAVVV